MALLAVAVLLMTLGLALWVLGYVEKGAHNGDRLAELGAGIVAGAIVSFAFWLVDRAVEERDRRREARDNERHAAIIERLSGQPARAEGSESPLHPTGVQPEGSI
jgi:hypothetical protein